MVSTTPARNSDAGLKDGIQKVVLEFLKQYDELSSSRNVGSSLCFDQALEYGEVKQMADKAALFKSVIFIGLPTFPAPLRSVQIRRQVFGQQVWHYTVLHGQASRRPPR